MSDETLYKAVKQYEEYKIIPCKDCKYFFAELGGDYGSCTRIQGGDVVKETDFCSRAKEFVTNKGSADCPLDKPPYYWNVDDIKITDNCNNVGENISSDVIERNYKKNLQNMMKSRNEFAEKQLQELKDEIERLRKQIKEKDGDDKCV